MNDHIPSERYLRTIKSYFSSNPTPTDQEVEDFAVLIDKRLREFAAQQPSFDYEAEWNDFVQTLYVFREDPRGFMNGDYSAATIEAKSARVEAPPRPVEASASAAAVETAPPPPAEEKAFPVGRVLKLAGLALLGFFFLFSSSCWMPFSGCADSGWLPASSATSNTVSFDHNLGTEPAEVFVYFRHSLQDPEFFPITRAWAQGDNGNPVTIVATTRAVRLHIVGGVPLHGTWSPGSGWKKGQSGFFRVFVRK